MKKLLKAALAVFAGAMLFASCETPVTPSKNNEKKPDEPKTTEPFCLKVFTEEDDLANWKQLGKFQFKMEFKFDMTPEEIEEALLAMEDDEDADPSADPTGKLKKGSTLSVKFFPPTGSNQLALRLVNYGGSDGTKLINNKFPAPGETVDGAYENCTITGLEGDNEGWYQADMVMPGLDTEFGFTFYYEKDDGSARDLKHFVLVKDVVIDKMLISLNSYNTDLVKNYYDSPAKIKAVVGTYSDLNSRCKVTLVPNYEGEGVEPVTFDILKDATIAVPESFARAGYALAGWYTDAACTAVNEFDITQPITQDVTIYAKWVELLMVTFDVSSQPGATTVLPGFVMEGGYLTKPANPTCDGFVFDYWATEANPGVSWNYEATPVTEAMTLYAHWLTAYTVTFNVPEGASAVDAQIVGEGRSATKPATDPTLEGQEFYGWYSDVACTEDFDFFATTITKDTTIYAKFGDPRSVE